MDTRPTDDPRPLITDGGLATTLAAAGHDVSGALWSARVLVEDPTSVLAAHAAFVRAGAQVLTTASYQATVDGLIHAGVRPSQAWRVIAGSVALARGAAEDVGREVTVAASSGTWNALQGHGAEYRPMPATITVDQLVAFHLERARILADAEPDVLLFETLPGLREVNAAARVATALDHPAWITVTTPDGVHTTDGEDLAEVARLVQSAPRVVAVGINCSPPEVVEPALGQLATATDRHLIARPNAGARWRDGSWRDELERAANGPGPRRWLEAGARIIGGCCGTTPADITAIAEGLAGPAS